LMTVIATASNPRFTVSRVDIDRPGLTYTADTLRDLRAERGDDVDMYFITGADALAQILTWRDVDSIFDLAHFVGCTRPGVDLESPVIGQLPQDKVTLMEVPALAISSTACRLRVQEHQPIWYLVPDGIVQYIAKRGLYQS
jgi:nicotinate-nucleotide adenylyltransferase